MNKPSSTHGDESSRSAGVAVILFGGGAAAAMFLAGGAEQGNLGVFLLCAGAALLVCPPRVKLPRALCLTAATVVLLSAASLLPARLFHPLRWRQDLAAVPDLPLPGTISAAPQQTLFWLAVLTVTILSGLFLLTQPLRSRTLLRLTVGAVGVCGIYAGLSIFAKLSGWTYPFTGGASFGFFPNRNHTATLLVTGSILAVGILPVAFRERRWLTVDWAVAMLTLCVSGLLFFSESRAGVMFLLVGIGVWMAGLGGRHLNRSLLLTLTIVLVAGLALFLSIKSEARDRLLLSLPATHPTTKNAATTVTVPPATAGEITADDRLRIYRDTLGVIRDAPWTGVGLGTFSLVFPMYRHDSASITLILHPESDWLMVAAETGLPALTGLGLLIFFALRNWRRAEDHPYWPLRWAIFAAALAAGLHGLVDVPVHRAALGWWIILLAGVALGPSRSPGEAQPSRVGSGWLARGTFILGGLLALALGVLLIRAEWFGGPALPPYVAKRAESEIMRVFTRRGSEPALDQARSAVQVSPLAPGLYHELGVIALGFYETDAEVERAFHLEQVLTPFAPVVPQTQGTAWLSVDPAHAAKLYTEALERQESLPPGSVGFRSDMANYWRELVATAVQVPPTQRLMWDAAAARGPAFILAWLEGASAEVAAEKIPSLASDQSFLSKLTADQHQRFLTVWNAKGDKQALQTFENTPAK